MGVSKLLEKLAEFQVKYSTWILVVVLLISVFMILGVPKLSLESDMSKMMPQDLPAYRLNDEVSNNFGAQDVILIILRYDQKLTKTTPQDIRNPEVISYLVDLENELLKESSVDSVTSVGKYFSGIPLNQNSIDYVFKSAPALNQFFSNDRTSSFMFVSSDIGGSEQKTDAIISLIDEKVNSLSIPAGISIQTTGSPIMRTTLTKIMGQDAIYTLTIAFICIFILLCALERSFIKAILISTPLMIGLLFTMGTMGWINLKISIATAGLGAMILGLGVEYGVFMLKRYHEEREKNKSRLDSLKVSVPAIGKAIFGSGLTTTVGFLALTFSILPMMQNLGLSLAIGIFYCLFSSIFISPVIYIVFEKLEYKFEDWLFKYVKKKEDGQHGV